MLWNGHFACVVCDSPCVASRGSDLHEAQGFADHAGSIKKPKLVFLILSSLPLNELMLLVARHPLPDYYSITLEISRDRMTSARQVTCTDKNTCPSSVDVGDLFLRRHINTACHKMVRRQHTTTVVLLAS